MFQISKTIKITKSLWEITDKSNILLYLASPDSLAIEKKGVISKINFGEISNFKIHFNNLLIFKDDLTIVGLSLIDFQTIDFELKEGEYFYRTQNFKSKNLILQKEVATFDSMNGIYFVDSNKKEYFENFSPTIIIDEKILGNLNNEIQRFDYSGDIIWTLDISEIGYFDHPFEVLRNSVEVQQFVGVYEDLLWVFLRNQVFLGIDIHTGKVMHKLYTVATECHQNQDYDQSFEPWFLALIPNANWFLDETTGTIKGLSRQCYAEVNIKKVIEEPKKSVFSNLFGIKKNTEAEPTIAVYHFFSHMRTLDLRNIASRFTVIDDDSKIIYFCDEDTGRWGLYDTHTKVFEYISEQIPVEKSKDKKGFTRLKEIKQGGNKVYVLDMQQTLHIFEKEINV